MKRMKTLRAIMVSLLTLMLCVRVLPSASASAASNFADVEGDDCSLTLKFIHEDQPITGVEFRVKAWKVGEFKNNGLYALEEYEDYLSFPARNGDRQWDRRAKALLAYIQSSHVTPAMSGTTNMEGTVTFAIESAEKGLYLLDTEKVVQGDTTYTTQPFLCSVPYAPEPWVNWQSDVTALPKIDVVTDTHDSGNPGDKTVDRQVLKTWNDEGHKEERPALVEVSLLKDGEVYDTVTLTAENNWRYSWSKLDADSTWMVAERVEGNYSVIVEQRGTTFQITNTWEDDLPEEPPPLIDIPDEPPPETDIPNEPENPTVTPPEDIEVPEDPTPLDPPPYTPPDDIDVPEDPTPLDHPPYTPPDDVDIPENPTPLDDYSILPQTGQLWWPVVPMMLSGLVLSVLGWKRGRDWDEADYSDET